jgi:hypothetical protein
MITGKLPSRYSGDLLQYESGLERKFLILLEAEPGIKMVTTQTVQLELAINGHKRRYTPDVLVIWSDHANWSHGAQQVVFKVKPYEILKREFADLQPKFRAAKQALARQGHGFRVVTLVEGHTRNGPNQGRAEPRVTPIEIPFQVYDDLGKDETWDYRGAMTRPGTIAALSRLPERPE